MLREGGNSEKYQKHGTAYNDFVTLLYSELPDLEEGELKEIKVALGTLMGDEAAD